jgi:transposase
VTSFSTIGLDIAKSVFQVRDVDVAGQVVLRRQLRRRYVLAFFSNCHRAWWVSTALGHTVRLTPPAYVKPYVKRQKNDTTDAEAVAGPARRRTVVVRVAAGSVGRG